MSQDNVAAVRAAFESYQAGDLDVVTELLDPEVYWRGPERGHLWWKRAPD